MENKILTDTPGSKSFHNLLEPIELIQSFQNNPPECFHSLAMENVPGFATVFNFLTTLNPSQKQSIEEFFILKKCPQLYRHPTYFTGTTVSEFGLFHKEMAPCDFIDNLLKKRSDYPFLIIKDIPTSSLFVGEESYKYSTQLMQDAVKKGFMIVEGQALAYVPIDFESIDEFLSRLKRSSRKEMKRKLKSEGLLSIELIKTGNKCFNIDSTLREYYQLYLNVFNQSSLQFDKLSYDFFKSVLQDASNKGIIFVYKAEGKLIGYNLCFIQNNILLDKYIGFSYPEAHDYNLYFISWFQNLRYAQKNKLTYYIAGWSDPEIKKHIGAKFVFTQHAVYVRNYFLRKILTKFKMYFESDRIWHETNHS